MSVASSLAGTRATPRAWQYRLVYLQSRIRVVVELWTPDLAVGRWGRSPLFPSYLLLRAVLRRVYKFALPRVSFIVGSLSEFHSNATSYNASRFVRVLVAQDSC